MSTGVGKKIEIIDVQVDDGIKIRGLGSAHHSAMAKFPLVTIYKDRSFRAAKSVKVAKRKGLKVMEVTPVERRSRRGQGSHAYSKAIRNVLLRDNLDLDVVILDARGPEKRSEKVSADVLVSIRNLVAGLGFGEAKGQLVVDLDVLSHHLRSKPSRTDSTAETWVSDLKAAKGGAYSASELESRLHVTRQALAERRSAFTIVYWTDPHGRSWYPKWQFDHEGKVLPGVKEVLRILQSRDTIKVLSTFLVPASGLGDRSVLDLILDKETEEALAHVRSLEGPR